MKRRPSPHSPPLPPSHDFVKWKWHQVVAQSFSLSFIWGRGITFNVFLMQFLPIFSFFLMKCGLEMQGKKNLKDRWCWFTVGWLQFVCFFPQVQFMNLSFLFSIVLFCREKFSVYIFYFCHHCGRFLFCFLFVGGRERGRAAAAWPVKRSPHFLVVWRDPFFTSKWKWCLILSKEIHFIGAVGYNYCITTQNSF